MLTTTTFALLKEYSYPLGDTTQDILDFAFDLAQLKASLPKKEYKELLRNYKWEHEDKVYLKIAEIFEKFTYTDLAAIEPNTLFVLAKHHKKYQNVISELLVSEEINNETVRKLIKKHRQPKIIKEDQPSIWRQTPQGVRYAQIPPIHDQTTGVALQGMMDSEGLTAGQIVAEAISLRQALKSGRLTWVSDSEELSEILFEEVVEDELSVNIEVQSELEIPSKVVTCDNLLDSEIDYSSNESTIDFDCSDSTLFPSDELFYFDENITDADWQQELATEIELMATNQCSETQSVRAIAIRDRVVWKKCPPHLSSWQPFVVRDIKGEFAMLEYYQHPVPIVDLDLINTLVTRCT